MPQAMQTTLRTVPWTSITFSGELPAVW